MQRNNTGLLVVIMLIVVVLAGGGYYLYSSGVIGGGGQAGTNGGIDIDPPTPTPVPIVILEAAEDIPANRLITSADKEALFVPVPVRPSELVEGDIREDEFDQYIANKVTILPINGTDRVRRNMFRIAGIAEKIPTPQPGQSARKAMPVLVPDLGDIVSPGNSVDVLTSIALRLPYLRVSGQEVEDDGRITLSIIDEPFDDVTTKVLAQNVPVLEVIPPPEEIPQGGSAPPPPAAPAEPVPADATPGPPGEPTPTPRPLYAVGANWTLILAVTEQEAELLKYSQDKNGVISVIIRRADDAETVTTTGVTLDLLLRLYSVPMPYAQPQIWVDMVRAPAPPQPPNQPPLVIPVPIPFGNPEAVPLPTQAAPEATATPTP